MNEQKFHISQGMVFRKVIGIRNVNLMRIKTRRTWRKTPREKARINNKFSRHEKQGPGYNPATMVESKCSHNNTFPGPQVHSASVICEYLLIKRVWFTMFSYQATIVQIQIAYLNIA